MPHALFAKVTPKPECFRETKEAIIDIIKPTLKEPGCIQYTFHEGKDEDSDSLFFYEVWRSKEDLEMHCKMPYTAAVIEKHKEWLIKPVEHTILTPVDPN